MTISQLIAVLVAYYVFKHFLGGSMTQGIKFPDAWQLEKGDLTWSARSTQAIEGVHGIQGRRPSICLIPIVCLLSATQTVPYIRQEATTRNLTSEVLTAQYFTPK